MLKISYPHRSRPCLIGLHSVAWNRFSHRHELVSVWAAGESAATAAPEPAAAAASAGAWGGPAEGPTTGVQVGSDHKLCTQRL